MSEIDYVGQYASAGFHLVELAPKDKAPTTEHWRTEKAATVNLETNNVGIQWGKKSRGLIDVDLDCLEAVDLAKSLLPMTGAIFGRAGKPRSHYLYYLRPIPEHFAGLKYVDPNTNECLVELRGDGLQTMVPPSIHPSGEVVEWDTYGEVTQLEADWLRQYVGRLASAIVIARQWGEGIRHDSALALAGALFRAGWNVASVEELITVVADYVDDEQVSDHIRAIRDTHESWENGEATTGWPKLAQLWNSEVVSSIRNWLGLSSQPLYALTDTGNAERFFDQYEEKICWVPEWNKWAIWSGTHWKQDQHLRIKQFAIESIKTIEKEADFVIDPEYKSAIFKWAAVSQAKTKIDAMLDLAKSYLARPAVEFDANQHYLNFRNTTVDLRNGRMMEHDRTHYITREAPVDYDPLAECPIFEKVVLDLVMGRKDVYDYLQVSLGYSCTGLTTEDVFFILYGPGRNGKSTVLETVSHVLGAYAKSARAETFFEQSSIPSDLAMLTGARFVAAAETESGQKISDSLVKRLTGGDKILARFLYGEWFEFEPAFKIWLATNHKPTISTQSIAIWERVRLIPCENVIPRADRDPSLRHHLRDIEPAGIARWLVEGAMRWYDHGLGEPPVDVTEATDEYRREMDIIGDFVSEICFTEGTVASSDLYKAYQSWARDNGRPVYGSRRFNSEMKEAGYPVTKDDGKNVFKGLSLREKVVDYSNPFGSPH